VFLKNDRTPGIVYENGTAWCGPEVWGSPPHASAA
jgi:hypothetical protein